MRRILFVLIAFLLFAHSPSYAFMNNSGPFKLNTGKELSLLFTDIGLHYAGDYFTSSIGAHEPGVLDKSDIPYFDRFASNYYSSRLSHLSDYTLGATSGILILSSLRRLTQNGNNKLIGILTDAVMFFETEACIIGLTQCVKGLSQRARPYVYNKDIAIIKRESSGSFMSFWSGHTSHAFAIATFCGYVYHNRYPASRLIIPIWISGLSCATATGVLRIRSGNHFPSDVIVGAISGTLMGWIVPRLHLSRNNQQNITLIPGGSNVSVISMIYHF